MIALIQRGGEARAVAVKHVTSANIKAALEKVDPADRLMTDQLKLYKYPGKQFADHKTVRHDIKQYVKGDAHVNTAEGFFANLKRGINGTFHHVGGNHLQKYVDEFAFKYNTRQETDGTRARLAVQYTEGKRLTYKQPIGLTRGK